VIRKVKYAAIRHFGKKNLKVGHAGTLDPLATGVMAVMLGSATKLSEYLTSEDKRYTANIKFGLTSDSMDLDGEIISERECSFTEEELLGAIKKFTGKITQIPPKYSAIKVDGRKLYSYARNGEDVEIPSREIEIYEFNLLSFDKVNYEAVVDVYCSKGTYIRSLANDLGEYLGCGALLSGLRRTRSGEFLIEDCVSLDELQTEGFDYESKILPCDEVISYMPVAEVLPQARKGFLNGNPTDLSLVEFSGEGELFRVYCEGEFYAVGKVEDGFLRVVKMIKVNV
jgi:tRNA pseudouridine55 synthase